MDSDSRSDTHAQTAARLRALRKLLFLCVGVVYANLHSVEAAPKSENDHLVPIPKYSGAPGIYRKLCYDKLFVTPSETARFMQLPGSLEVETAVSLYRDSRKIDGLPGGYWLTLTQPSTPLFGSVPYVDVKKPVDLKTIQIRRCDAPLRESAALAVHDLWMKMLKQACKELGSRLHFVHLKRRKGRARYFFPLISSLR